MGCLHNREDTTLENDIVYEFSAFGYGKRWIEDGVGYGTIMSYDTSPVSTFPNTIPYFSNPDVTFLSTSTGNYGTEDNAKVLKLTAPYVSNFRNALVQSIVPSRYSLTVNELSAVSFKIVWRLSLDSIVGVNVSVVGDENIALGSPSVLSFDSSTWNSSQTILIVAKPDTDTVSNSATISISSSSFNTTEGKCF